MQKCKTFLFTSFPDLSKNVRKRAYFWTKKIEAKSDQKAHLKAELVFAYEIKKCSAQKVDRWVVFVSPNFEKYVREMKKSKIASKIMALSRISPTR